MISVILQSLVMLLLTEEANDTNLTVLSVPMFEKICNNKNLQDMWEMLQLETEIFYCSKKFLR
jgi:hypothetical protein